MGLNILLNLPRIMLLTVLLIACNDGAAISSLHLKQSVIQKNSTTMASNYLSLDTWIPLRELSMQEIQNRFSISEEHIDKDTGYEKLSELTEFYNPDTHPGHFYFRNEKFVMLYVGKSKELEQLDSKVLQDNLGGSGIRLRSRAGKRFNHYVYPEKGVAFSADQNGVRFLEIFPPTSLEAYKSEIYEEPPPFIK
jgi:hypothetical protein